MYLPSPNLSIRSSILGIRCRHQLQRHCSAYGSLHISSACCLSWGLIQLGDPFVGNGKGSIGILQAAIAGGLCHAPALAPSAPIGGRGFHPRSKTPHPLIHWGICQLPSGQLQVLDRRWAAHSSLIVMSSIAQLLPFSWVNFPQHTFIPRYAFAIVSSGVLCWNSRKGHR